MTAPLEHFRSVLMADAELQSLLGPLEDDAAFADAALAVAKARGIALDRDTLTTVTRRDPAALSRFLPAPATATAWPSAGWLPVDVPMLATGIYVDWAWIGPPTGRVFDEVARRRALDRPLSRLLRWRMTLADFVRGYGGAEKPAGLIFHMSRCGSTLVSRMLAALPGALSVSESPAINAVLQLPYLYPASPAQEHAAILSAMLGAFSRRDPSFIKLDAWHALALPQFRNAAPDVPWTFLYREPVEVLVSQQRASGPQLLSGILPSRVYGIAGFETMPEAELSARVLEKICAAAAARDGGLLCDYRELPQAVEHRILPHFGVACSETEREALARTACAGSKIAGHFVPDSGDKQSEADEELRALAERHVGGVHRQLQRLRATQR
ncbi:MAG TPA: hypothetical protein VHU87_10025 [Rhizomicrobium sp.]|jgi:hypothetical protein|nr:hypothetical protein [Rhizomicrobium sp.]